MDQIESVAHGVLFKMCFSTQLIYDFKDGCGTFGFVCVDLDKVPDETLESFRLIGANIPDDMRYSTIGTLKITLIMDRLVMIIIIELIKL